MALKRKGKHVRVQRRAAVIRAFKVAPLRGHIDFDLPHHPHHPFNAEQWITGDGRRIAISDLGDDHIISIVDYQLRNWALKTLQASPRPNVDSLESFISSHAKMFEKARPEFYQVILEGARRGIISGKLLAYFTICREQLVVSGAPNIEGTITIHSGHKVK